MSAGRYLFCCLFVGLAGWQVNNQHWPWLAIDIGMFLLLIGDSIVDALKEDRKK